MKTKLFTLLSASLLFVSTQAFAQDEPAEGDPGAAPAAAPAEGAPAAAPAAAPAETPPAAPAAARSEMFVGFDLAPAFNVKPSGGNVRFAFGPEIGMKYFLMPVLLSFGDSITGLNLLPRFKYDLEVIPNLIISPFGGLNVGFGFFDGGKTIDMGVGIGARGTYMITPSIGVFLEPFGMDFNFFHWMSIGDNSATDSTLTVQYRLLFGGHYRF
jgi:hypothetical protein